MPPNPTDQKWSWVIAFACCFINCLLYGVIRLSGLLMVATVETFQVSRAKAAMPFSVSTSVRNLSGIFVGYFGQKFGLRPVIGAGCLLASFGAGLCFFASDIFWITISWGVIFGMGCGLGTCLLPLAINQHFDKHRGKASGISYSGSYIGSFLFPPIVVMLLEHYGLNGAFLVISSTLLNGLAASLLFQSKSVNKLDKKELKQQQLESKPTSTELENCTKNIWQKILHHVKWTDSFLKTKELPKTQEIPSIYLIAAETFKDSDEKQYAYSSYFDAEFFAKYIDAAENEVSACKELNSKSNRSFVSRRYAENLHFHSKNVLFKGKLKTEYKLSIAKLRQTLLVNFFRRRYSFNSNLQRIPDDDVKLLYFKNFNCILCSTLLDKIIHAKPHVHNFNNNDFLLKENLIEEIYKKDVENLAALNQTSQVNYSHSVAESLSKPQYKSVSSNIPVSKTKNFEKSEITSGSRGNCSWKISRQNQHRVSLVPAGAPSLSNLCASDLKSSSKYENPSEGDIQSFIKSSWYDKFGKCCFGWFRLHAHPMFVVIATTMSFHTLVTVCMITIIEDFAKDLHVPDNEVHYALMTLSTADLLGALTMGIITDHGLISRCYFIVLCFLGTGIFSIAISFSQNLTMLLTLVAFYGIFETGVIITFPLLIAQFIEVKKQAVALASSNALSSPTVLLVPLIIGYFRDRVGCYSGVFYVLGALSLSSSLIWLVASYLFNKRSKRNKFELCC
ncbi:uncharacterized protein LOC129964272 [Argiope bruennichi]|uniref:Monocarboxylate transporter 9 like protein n=1 Tax=Argiope bruennichi TaxID=94029 RepID=A0A8T0F2Y5_ARGBR|nr:uncharacterized protein LOC129964272 [Argiope bruennichi]XP_055934999.1 uncharacterized protein LOC129964272 [Argiope bruennichi]XP_055935000.1 uncharacterized protein LOC129964272 [Argiope bruennichi]KAF8782892.1 Monocarboxylate transporter 9 like protein [Argiope bruennichi]